jgi:hypothetical protein
MFGNTQLKDQLLSKGNFEDPDAQIEISDDLRKRVSESLLYRKLKKELHDLIDKGNYEDVSIEHLRILRYLSDPTAFYSDDSEVIRRESQHNSFLERVLENNKDLAAQFEEVKKLKKSELIPSASEKEVCLFKLWLNDVTVFEYKLLKAFVSICKYGHQLGEYTNNHKRELWFPVNTKNLKKLSKDRKMPTLAVSRKLHEELVFIATNQSALFHLLVRVADDHVVQDPETGVKYEFESRVLPRIGNRIILTMGAVKFNTNIQKLELSGRYGTSARVPTSAIG